MITYRELKEQLHKLEMENVDILNMEVVLEGCDCIGDCIGVEIYPDFSTGKDQLFFNRDPQS